MYVYDRTNMWFKISEKKNTQYKGNFRHKTNYCIILPKKAAQNIEEIPSRESYPSHRISNLRAVPLGHINLVSTRFLVTKQINMADPM